MASCSITSIARPELTPGAALPLIDAAGYMLYRVSTSGPLISLDLGHRAQRDHRPARVAHPQPADVVHLVADTCASDWAMTCQVRPKRLKSLT